MDPWHGTTEAGETCVITVLLVDDQRAVRGVVRMQLELEPDMRIVGEAGTVAQALELARAGRFWSFADAAYQSSTSGPGA